MHTSGFLSIRYPLYFLTLILSLPALCIDLSSATSLAGNLVRELGVTPKQAEGGAGSLLKLVGEKLSSADFAKITSAIPDASALMSAAPSAPAKSSGFDASSLIARHCPLSSNLNPWVWIRR